MMRWYGHTNELMDKFRPRNAKMSHNQTSLAQRRKSSSSQQPVKSILAKEKLSYNYHMINSYLFFLSKKIK